MQKRLIFAAILGFVGFVTSFGAHAVAVNLPVYAQQVGVGLAMIGLLIAAYDFAEIIAKPIFGAIGDRQGMKKTMLLGIALFTIASGLYLFINPNLLLLVRFLQGIGAAALSAVSLALVGEYYKQNRGKAYGIYNAIKGSGYVISPAIGGAIVLQSNFSTIFIATAAIGALAFMFSLFLPDPRKKISLADEDNEFSLNSFVAVFKEPKLMPWYVVTVVNMFFVGILFGFLPVRVYALGFDPLTTGIILSLVALSYLLIQPVAGALADRTNIVTTVRAGLIISALGIIFIAFATGPILALLSVVSGIGVGIVWTNTDALVSGLAQKGKMGATMGAAGSFKEFGDMVGPLLIGFLSQAFGLASGFVICGILGLLSVLIISRPAPKHTSKAQVVLK